MEQPPGPERKAVHVEVDSYADLVGSEAALAWLDRARGLTEPMVPQGRGVLALWFLGSEGPRLRKPTAANWRDASERWLAGELYGLSFGEEMGGVEARAWAQGAVDEGVAHRFDLRTSLRRLATPLEEFQPALVDLLADGARSLHAATGFIYVDRALDPYEDVMGLRGSDQLERLRERVRGYYWANVLSEGHLSRLGGFERVAAEAPVYRVEDLSGGAGTLALLQLSESVAHYTDDQLKALRDFFAPVLPAGRPGDRDPVSPPVRVFEDGPRPDPDTGLLPPEPRPVPRTRRAPVELPVEVRPDAVWETALFTLVLKERLRPVQEQALRQAVEQWAAVGVNGGYGGLMHSADSPHATTAASGAPVVLWSADLGSAGQAAIDVLVSMVRTVCGTYRIQPVKLVVGDPE